MMGYFVERTLPGDEYGSHAVRRSRHYLAYIPDEAAKTDYAPGRDAASRIAEAAERVTAFTRTASGCPTRVAGLTGLLSRSEGIGSSTIENYSLPLVKVITAHATGDRPHQRPVLSRFRSPTATAVLAVRSSRSCCAGTE